MIGVDLVPISLTRLCGCNLSLSRQDKSYMTSSGVFISGTRLGQYDEVGSKCCSIL